MTSPAAGVLSVGDDCPAAPQGEGGNAGQLVIIGIDLSLTSTGIATPAGVDLIKSAGGKNDTLQQRSARLGRIRNRLLDRCKTADLVVIEGPAYNSRDGHAHDRSGLWWMVVRGLHVNRIPVAVVVPSQLQKYATGKGRADKFAVHAAVIKRYPDIDVVGPDQADALVLRAMGMDWLEQPLAVVPKAQRDTLDKVAWPQVMCR
jgi:Holliday junction resolvasome RuvABC endonuclease subunit